MYFVKNCDEKFPKFDIVRKNLFGANTEKCHVKAIISVFFQNLALMVLQINFSSTLSTIGFIGKSKMKVKIYYRTGPRSAIFGCSRACQT